MRLPGHARQAVYASAGNLYPVHVYLYVKPDRIEPGPRRHYLLPPRARAAGRDQPGASVVAGPRGPTRRAFDSSAFSVYSVADSAPSSRCTAAGREICASWRAGVIAHLLESTAPDHQIGLCQTGGFDFTQVAPLPGRPAPRIPPGLVGGAISDSDTTLEALARESAALAAMVDAAARAASPQGAALARPERPRDGLARALSSYVAERWAAEPVRVVVVDGLPGPGGERAAVSPGGRTRPARPPRAELGEALRGGERQAGERHRQHLGRGAETPARRSRRQLLRPRGDSLLLVSMARSLRERFSRDVPLVHLFEHPTVSQQGGVPEDARGERPPLRKARMRRRPGRAGRGGWRPVATPSPRAPGGSASAAPGGSEAARTGAGLAPGQAGG